MNLTLTQFFRVFIPIENQAGSALVITALFVIRIWPHSMRMTARAILRALIPNIESRNATPVAPSFSR
jgi:hypothetical protein